MQRWHLTVGLAGLALIGAALAPRLSALTQIAVAPPTPPAPPPIPEILPTPVAPPAAPSVAGGHLRLEAGLDRTALLAGSPSERFLAITVSAPDDLGSSFRRPVDLAVVLDASGSMSARGKIDYAKRAAKLLASSMERGDTYTLVTFNDDAVTVVPATRVDDPTVIHRAIDRVYEGGGTNLYAGMDRGAHEVQRSLEPGAVGRVVVLSDGNANVGVTDPSALSRYASTLAGQGVAVSTIGLGLDYNEDLLATISDVGGGTYDFVDDPRELEAVFTDELDRTASVVARSTSVSISLPDGVTPVEVIGWDAERTETGWTVWMGDVYAGESRKIIARVRVDAPDVGTLQVASLAADYTDLVEDRAARTEAVAQATVTRSHADVERSVDTTRAAEANRAWGNWYLDMSTRAYERGEVTESRRLLRQGRSVLSEASQAYSAPMLQQDIQALEELDDIVVSHEAGSDAGKRAIKSAKETYRGRAR